MLRERIDIWAEFDEDGGSVLCGSRECLTALEAVMKEITEKPDDTAGAVSVSASDGNVSVSAFATDGGHEVHVYIGQSDSWFTVEC